MDIYSWDRLVSGFYWMYNSMDFNDVKLVEVSGTEVNTMGTDHYTHTDDYQTQVFIKLADAPVVNAQVLEQLQALAFRKFHTVNDGCKFPFRTEGYWRMSAIIDPRDKESGREDKLYPYPVPMEVEGFDAQAFIEKLVDIEEGGAESMRYRGFSICRLTGEGLGNLEYKYKGWRWPDGLVHYIRLGVPPSFAFYKFIMGADAPHAALPNYGRAADE